DARAAASVGAGGSRFGAVLQVPRVPKSLGLPGRGRRRLAGSRDQSRGNVASAASLTRGLPPRLRPALAGSPRTFGCTYTSRVAALRPRPPQNLPGGAAATTARGQWRRRAGAGDSVSRRRRASETPLRHCVEERQHGATRQAGTPRRLHWRRHSVSAEALRRGGGWPRHPGISAREELAPELAFYSNEVHTSRRARPQQAAPLRPARARPRASETVASDLSRQFASGLFRQRAAAFAAGESGENSGGLASSRSGSGRRHRPLDRNKQLLRRRDAQTPARCGATQAESPAEPVLRRDRIRQSPPELLPRARRSVRGLLDAHGQSTHAAVCRRPQRCSRLPLHSGAGTCRQRKKKKRGGKGEREEEAQEKRQGERTRCGRDRGEGENERRRKKREESEEARARAEAEEERGESAEEAGEKGRRKERRREDARKRNRGRKRRRSRTRTTGVRTGLVPIFARERLGGFDWHDVCTAHARRPRRSGRGLLSSCLRRNRRRSREVHLKRKADRKKSNRKTWERQRRERAVQ
ncbi:aldo/keto reductase family oxidoreductase, partial [Toxoplasma gondii VEG]